MAKKKQSDDSAEDEGKVLTSVEMRREYKAEHPEEPDHPAGSEAARAAARQATQAAIPLAPIVPADGNKTK